MTSSANAAGAIEITKGNFDELTKGKNSFVKFVRAVSNVSNVLNVWYLIS